jgi:hypothetical protein
MNPTPSGAGGPAARGRPQGPAGNREGRRGERQTNRALPAAQARLRRAGELQEGRQARPATARRLRSRLKTSGGVHRHAFLPGSGRGRGTAQRGRAARGRPWRGARGETISPGRWLPRTGSKRDEVREPRKGRQSRERPAGLPVGRLRRAGPRTSEKGRGHKLRGGCGGHACRRQAGRGRTLGGRKPRRGSGAPNGLGREGRTGWPCGARPRGRRPGVWRRASGRAAGRNGEGAAAAERRWGCTAKRETPGGRTPDALAALTK